MEDASTEQQVHVCWQKFMIAVLKARFQAEAASAALADEWDRGSDFDDCASAAGDLFPVDDESDIVQYIPGGCSFLRDSRCLCDRGHPTHSSQL